MVHKICEYSNGITGDDLIGINDTLHELSQEDYISKFRYFTLVGFAHNDLLVPFPTAVICPVNPYPVLNFYSGLSVVGCYGFSMPYLDLKCENVKLGNIAQEHWVWNNGKEYGEKDNYSHSEFNEDMIKRLYEQRDEAMNWRRVDLNIGKLFLPLAHDICIKKPAPLIKVQFQSEPASKLLELFSEILYLDHNL